MKQLTINALYHLQETIAADLFEGCTYPWEALDKIRGYIVRLGESLPAERFEKRGEHIWVAKSAHVFDNAYLGDYCIIDEEAEIRHCAFIRENAIVGKNAVVGNSTELKNAILFDRVQVPHYNYVGDSVLGYRVHMGAGAVTSNVKSDKSLVTVRTEAGDVWTGLKKYGAMLGDNVEVGCNSVLNPGTVVGRNTTIYPISMVRGFVPADSIFKKQNNIVKKV